MNDKDRINKQPTSETREEGGGRRAVAGNVREKGQDPSPDDRERGERSDAEPAGAGDRGAG